MSLHHARLDQFTWNKETRTLSAEASDLGLVTGLPIPRTFTVMSRTSVDFVLVDTHKDAEGDVTHWEYKSLNLPAPIILIIWND